MPTALYTPRVNNNDDTVRLSHFFVESGAHVKTGDPVADVETDKATFTVEAEQDGYLLAFNAHKGDTIEVGSVLAWIGSSPEEVIPGSKPAEPATTSARPVQSTTLRAALLLAQYGIDAAQVPSTAERLSAGEVEQYIAERGLQRKSAPSRPASNASASLEKVVLPAGQTVEFTPEERGMLRTVEWHKREAVAAYVEITYDEAAWATHASEFQKSNKLLMSPLLSLMAWRLVQVAKTQPLINATVNGSARYEYEHVDLGFTVQAGQRLYVAVVHEAESLPEGEFVQKLGDLQRRAMKSELRPEETSGATVCFSSMARWPVSRHMPILMPYTSLMVAHTAPRDGRATLGATYDHRVLSGAAVTLALLELAHP